MTPNTSDQKYKTIEMLLSLRGTTLEKAPEAENAESEVKSAPELKNFHYSSFLFPLPFSSIFWQFFCQFHAAGRNFNEERENGRFNLDPWINRTNPVRSCFLR